MPGFVICREENATCRGRGSSSYRRQTILTCISTAQPSLEPRRSLDRWHWRTKSKRHRRLCRELLHRRQLTLSRKGKSRGLLVRAASALPAARSTRTPPKGGEQKRLYTRAHPVSLAAYKCSFLRNRFLPEVVSIFHVPKRLGELLAGGAGEITGLSGGQRRAAALSFRQDNVGVKDGPGHGGARSRCREAVIPQKATPN